MNDRIQITETFNQHLPPSRTLVIIPTYNERENVELLFQAFKELGLDADLFIADDASPDNTVAAVAERASSFPHRIFLMRRRGKFGLGVAYLDAYRAAVSRLPEYKCFVQMDADFSHDPRMVPLLVEKATAYGVAVGSRYVQGGATPDWNHWRYLLSHTGNIYARWILRLFFPSYLIQDSTSGFVAWRRDVIERVLEHPIYGDGYAFQTAIKLVAFRLGFPALEVPIIFRDRRLGVSKLNHHIIFEAFWMPWRLGFSFWSMSDVRPVAWPQGPDLLTVPEKFHDNSQEMWDRYYSSEEGKDAFAKLIHWGREYYFGKLFGRRVIKLGGPAKEYLELGVGTAQTLLRLQKMTGARCVGIEKTPRAHALGQTYAKQCEIVLGDAMHLPFADKSFDVVYSLGLLEHFEPQEQMRLLREQARVARQSVLLEVPARTPHMRLVMWFNRTVRKRRGVWADDELFSPARFRKKFPALPFTYFFDWASGGMTCWFALRPEDVLEKVECRR